jgi:drug/metabolite transporter (DMT)-like permease
MTPHSTSRLQILATATLFSTGGAAIKATTLSSWQVAGFRSGIAALAIFLLMPTARSRWTWPMMAVGSFYAATLILFVWANKLTTAANTIFLQSTAPLYILLLAPWLLREPIRRQDILYLIAMTIGLTTFFVGVDHPVASAPSPAQGKIFALLSGITWGLTLMGLRWMGRREEHAAGSAAATVVSGNVIAFLACLPWALPVAASQVADWLVVGYLGVFQIGLAYTLLTVAMRHVPAFEASLLLLLEPVLNPIWAWLIHGEKPGLWSLLGGAIILVATTLKTLRSVRINSSLP